MTAAQADGLSAAFHLAGFVIAVLLGRSALRSADGDEERRIALAFTLAWLVLFATSAGFHASPKDRWYTMPLLAGDHGGIFLLVAASYTPLVLVMPRRAARRFLMLVWAIAVAGLIAALVAFSTGHGAAFDRHSWPAHLAHGLLPPVLFGRLFFPRLSAGIIACFLGSLAIYAAGLVFYGAEATWARPWGHPIWHGSILAGSLLNFAGLRMLLAQSPARQP